jgi:DNA-directed RNA polymerase II subunit RPB1
MVKQLRAPRRELVSHIEFGVFSPEEIKRSSVVTVTEPSMYSSSLPIPGGVADHRMGSVDRRLSCGTCKKSIINCPGHPGAIALSYPVLHPSFVDVVLKILKAVCFLCSELLLSPADVAVLRRCKDRKQRLATASLLARGKRACPHCAGPVPVYSKQVQTIKCDFSKAVFNDPEEAQYCQRPFTASEVRTILQTVSDEDYLLLGLNPKAARPENLVLTTLVVPPPVVRPSIVISEGSKARGQDDLTGKYCEIIKANASVKQILESEASSIPMLGLSIAAQQAVNDLAFHVSTLMNNDVRGQRHSVQRSGLPTKSIMSRLKGKEGRIRGFLMGKRVDFSARSVISPDCQMDIDQVGIPELVAERLTVPIHVMASNLEAVRALVRDPAGPAKAICRGGKCAVILALADREREAKALAAGDLVERSLQNDDIVLFNRQPSLHLGSMMGYRVLICKGSRTFRLNLACTGVSNADYDGDEMNVHVPQDPASQAEARLLMAVPQHIISAQSNKPSIGLVQDTLIGAWLLSGEDVALSREQLCVLHLCLKYPKKPVAAKRLFSGREAFSLLLPEALTYQNARTGVEIQAGALLRGRLCRQTLGTASGSLVHHLWLFHGPGPTQEFLSDCQRLVGKWLQWRGFSIRLSDCEPDSVIRDKIQSLVALAESKSLAISRNEDLRDNPREVLEEAISSIANKVLTDAGKIVHSRLSEASNALYQDVLSGAKGSLVNITQLMGLVGQQSVEGQRVNQEAPLDAGLACKGFVRNSYFQGLSSQEFFMHTMAGREGLIDTSVKTSSTGYLQRKLMKGMESIRVLYDKTCRNSRQNIIQFEYGADGYDAVYLVRQPLEPLRLGPERLRAELLEAEWPALHACWRGLLQSKLRRVCKELPAVGYVPVAFDAHFAQLAALPAAARPVPPERLLREVEALCAELCACGFGWRSPLELLLRWHLRHRRVGHLPWEALQACFAFLRETCARAEVAPGEAIGPLASTSIGEPLTQLTLNTFHKAGIKAHNVTLGVPRIKELIDCTKNPKTPSMSLVLLPSFAAAPEAAEALRLSLVEFHLCEAVLDARFLHEPDFFRSDALAADAGLVARLRLVREAPPASFGACVARLRLDPFLLVPRRLTPADVAELVEARCACHVLASEELEDEWVLRIRYTALAEGSAEPHELRALTEEITHKLCKELLLGGLPGVQRAVLGQEQFLRFSPDAGAVPEACCQITTHGSNLSAVFGLGGCLDVTRCVSNDVHEVLAVLGIEAATAVLFEQFQYTLQFDGSYINERHLLLLVSFMTSLGGLLPVSRHGINKLVDSGPLARASFEEVADRLAESCVYGDTDPVLCHSSRIMVGERCQVGTGICRTLREGPPPCEESDAESVIFTMLNEECFDALKIRGHAAREAQTEMPFTEEAVGAAGAFYGKASAGSSLELLGQQAAASEYAPSSPKLLLASKKRKFEPALA